MTFEITPNTPHLPRSWGLRYHVVEGSGQTRTSVSQHRSLAAAHKAAAQWSYPARVAVLDRQTGAVEAVER